MAESPPTDAINVINLCCMCLQETKLEVITPSQFEFLELLTQFQIDPSDIHQACSTCLAKLDDFSAFCSTIRSSIYGFVGLFKNIIVSDDERQEDTVVEESLTNEPMQEDIEYFEDSHDDELEPDAEVTTGQTAPFLSSDDKEQLLKPEIRVETIEERIQRIMADSSDDEMSYVIESLNAPNKRTPKSRPVITCEICGKTFDKLSKKTAHALSHTDQRMYVCSHEGCDRKFKSKQSFKEHESTHTGDYPMFCAFACGRGFHSKQNKQNHEALHTNERPFQCEICEKRYIQKRALDDHYRRQHSTSEADIPCEVCGKLFRLKSALSSHLRTHSDERRFKCQQCPLAYKHSSHLRDHEKTHQEAQYTCSICDAKFALKQALKRHLRFHEGVKNHRCVMESCNKSFVEKCDLVKHMRTHTGFKPFICAICHQRFSNKETLVKHHHEHHQHS